MIRMDALVTLNGLEDDINQVTVMKIRKTGGAVVEIKATTDATSGTVRRTKKTLPNAVVSTERVTNATTEAEIAKVGRIVEEADLTVMDHREDIALTRGTLATGDLTETEEMIRKIPPMTTVGITTLEGVREETDTDLMRAAMGDRPADPTVGAEMEEEDLHRAVLILPTVMAMGVEATEEDGTVTVAMIDVDAVTTGGLVEDRAKANSFLWMLRIS